eukprot:CAMPEP_0181249984 /NCGR_PEP_ID=MMETSP1096-20121128/46064_1 /TAXON_ID=156174 ORGANISM="Chrysochromulina ericina, Strain CCMP281" /NCGR_SAMPLE_ID=MMETSP1096 /ASSEMBLY_ACC=CAM_ASM_000453 /LENGTH=87 /DNA_ID=CAMNT_0023347395 /DNA_START=511 /DNA_END=774 /DNA_ORIENTATION=-
MCFIETIREVQQSAARVGCRYRVLVHLVGLVALFCVQRAASGIEVGGHKSVTHVLREAHLATSFISLRTKVSVVRVKGSPSTKSTAA